MGILSRGHLTPGDILTVMTSAGPAPKVGILEASQPNFILYTYALLNHKVSVFPFLPGIVLQY